MNEQNNYIVYMHINKINDKKYIGITCQMPRKRWKNGYGYDVGCYFRNAIDKYGWNNFEHVVLFKNLSQKQAKEKEIELIKKYNTMNRNLGYNRTEGGDGCQGIIMSNETKQKFFMDVSTSLNEEFFDILGILYTKPGLQLYVHQTFLSLLNKSQLAFKENDSKKFDKRTIDAIMGS